MVIKLNDFGVVVIILSLCVAMSEWIRKWKSRNNVILAPGSFGLPFIGETLSLLLPTYNSHDLHPFFKSRFQSYGTIFRTSILGRPVVVSRDEEFNNYIVQQEGKSVELWYLDTFSKVLGADDKQRMNGIGTIHKCLRNCLLKQIGADTLKQTLLPQMEHFFKATLSEWSSKSSLEFKRASFTMFINLTAKLLISHDATKSSINLSEEFQTILDNSFAFPGIPGSAYHKCIKAKNKVINMCKDLFNQRRVTDETYKGDMVDQLVDYTDLKNLISENSALHIIFLSLLAAPEASSMTLTFLVMLLSDHPLVIKDLEAEHEALILKRENKTSSLSWEEYKSMTFTHYVINEALRLLNGSPGLLRRARKDIKIKGITIPKGWTIMVVNAHLHLCPNTFPDPLHFNPWRWKDLEGRDISSNYMPFSRGIRQCPASEYTRLQIATFIHLLITNYRWSKTQQGYFVRKPLLGFGKGFHINLVDK